jgi:uncharacterized protein (UPF0332 family)
MNEAPMNQFIQYRLLQSQESIEEAKTLYQAAMLRGAVNRAYYAMFYAVMALCVFRKQAISKHAGIIAFFDREYVKTGIFSKEMSRSLHQAFQQRQENDYGEIVSVSPEEAMQTLKTAQDFVSAVNEYLGMI